MTDTMEGLGTIKFNAPYVTVSEAKLYMHWDRQAPTDRDEILRRTIGACCTRMQHFLNRPVAPTPIIERKDGWGGEYVILRYSPVVKLVSCKEWQSSGGFVDLPESTPESPVDGVQVNYLEGWIMRTFSGYSWPRPFFPGSRNIEITYVAGYNPIPDDIWMGTMELIAHWWHNTQEAGGAGAKPNAYGGGGGDKGPWPGIPFRVMEMVDDYRLPSIA
jgi:hypothetical protein